MRKILVPTDFSPLASFAAETAMQIATRSGSEVIIMHVVEMPGASFSVTGQAAPNAEFDLYTLKLIKKTKTDLAALAMGYQDKGVKVSTDIHVGNAYEAIAELITDQEVDLVVMGSHGSKGWEETLVGSTAEKVVRRSNCPVLVIKQELDWDNTKNIVYAADFEEENHVVEKVKELQELLDAKLHLVKVNTPSNFMSDRNGKQIISDFAERHQLKNYTVNIYNEREEEDGIIYFAEEINADLIALGTHGRSGILHLLSGSIAEDVVNHANRPVWTCRIN